ncbi:cephalosporin hydroxylase family protein [Limobrevibacterium gyesilva]|uniref:Cephalosporin hydroxylase family protein n=1 Tax=Limobrevibacterium gyesilva TaxID=2991712 RepID=A0AA42CJ88_9PROT|nr:cephalosporin hydroxylase family protein [Limobrevibacterium gyesilva]MCW3476672.1 cephalosporin hydroxylase family protein [Limobrevibacterium gyesilva]
MLTIDETRGQVMVAGVDGTSRVHPMDSPEAFEAVSAAWLRCGWDVKYVYGFTWMGRPIIQLPEDIIRIQEVIWRLRPDVIVETGVAHGGSLVFYAGLFAALGHGRVIGVDIEIRPHNRAAIEAHPMSSRIALIEGSSIAAETVAAVRAQIGPGESVLVILDSNHSFRHVAAELDLYAPLVTPGSYIVACDGIMAQVAGAPRTAPDWTWNNPISAVETFLAHTPDFMPEEPGFAFNEGVVRDRVTYWPKSFLKRRPAGAS